MWRLSDLYREEIFISFSRSEANGMIFTFVWAFDKKGDWDFIEKTSQIFSDQVLKFTW